MLTDSARRLGDYADRLDRFKERSRYRGSSRPDTHAAATSATAKLRWYETMIGDLRAAVKLRAEIDGLLIDAQALVDAVTFNDSGSLVAGQWRGGSGGLLSRSTIAAGDGLRTRLLAIRRLTEIQPPT